METSGRVGSVAVVTGASRGIGEAAAVAMARDGWTVALLARTASELDAVRDRIEQDGGRAASVPADVSDLSAIRRAWARILEHLGEPECLVNSAAVVEPVGPAAATDPGQWAGSVEINLIGAFFCTRVALEGMVRRGRGSVLNIVSGMGQRVFPGFSAYSVAKAGLIHLTRILAEELRASGITVNALDPGVVDTSMQERLRMMSPQRVGGGMVERLRQLYEQGRLSSPERIGRWIAAFLRGKAREVTGMVGDMSEYEARYGIPSSYP